MQEAIEEGEIEWRFVNRREVLKADVTHPACMDSLKCDINSKAMPTMSE